MVIFDGLRRAYHYGRYSKVKALLGPNKNSLLDIGCGKPCECMPDGSFIRYMGDGVGIDLEGCRGGFNFVRADLYQIPFHNKSFGALTAMEVIEHVGDIDRALDSLSDVLRDDGVLVISTPNNCVLWRVLWFFWCRTIGRMWDGKHKAKLRGAEWLNLFRNRFEVVEYVTHWGVDLIVKMRKRNR